jgi:hypothetical protein
MLASSTADLKVPSRKASGWQKLRLSEKKIISLAKAPSRKASGWRAYPPRQIGRPPEDRPQWNSFPLRLSAEADRSLRLCEK